MNDCRCKWIGWIIFLGLGVVLAAGLSLCLGAANLSFSQVISFLRGQADENTRLILTNIRLPRIILSFSVGASLALAGVLLQGIFRNPLVEPYTLGVSGGAALGVCLNIILKLSAKFGSLSLPLCGFVGAVLAVILVYKISSRRGSLDMHSLLLSGVMFSFITASLFMLIMAMFHGADLQGIIFWMMGALGEPDWGLVKIISIVCLIGLILSYLFAVVLNALGLGEEEAAHLGVDVVKVKKILFLLASLLTGTAVACAGVIGFVGLVVPHFMRRLVGRDHRILIIVCWLAGGLFLLLSDTLARTIIAPLELPVGVVTGIVGGSVFVYMLSARKS
jgi:iron complex transport system permease protein